MEVASEMDSRPFFFVLILLIGEAAGVTVHWSCPPSVFEKESACLKQMGVRFVESPSYNITQLLSNCRSRKGGESYDCFRDATADCVASKEVNDIVRQGQKDYLEPGLDYICGFDELIEANHWCFAALIRRREPYGCFRQAMRNHSSEFEEWNRNDQIELNNLKTLMCSFVTDLSRCHHDITQAGCGDKALADAIGNFWYSSNAEWCE